MFFSLDPDGATVSCRLQPVLKFEGGAQAYPGLCMPPPLLQPSPMNPDNIVRNKTKENRCLVERTFIFPYLFSSNVSAHNLEASVQSYSHHTGYYHLKDSYDAR